MGESDILDVQVWLYDSVSSGPVRADDLFNRAVEAFAPIPENTLRLALWNLVGEGKVRVTSDNYVKAA